MLCTYTIQALSIVPGLIIYHEARYKVSKVRCFCFCKNVKIETFY